MTQSAPQQPEPDVDEAVIQGTVQPASLPTSRRSPLLAMIAAGVLTLLMVIAAGTAVVNLQQRAESGTKANLAQLALVISEETSRSFQAVDLVLKDVLTHLTEDGMGRAQLETAMISRKWHDELVSHTAALAQIDNILLIGADGKVANTARSWPVPVLDLADREQYTHFRDHDTTDIFVSAPVRNRVDGGWVFQLARRINDPEGRFAGVVSAAVRLAYFEAFYKSVALGEGGSIGLLRSDGMMLARHPFVESMIGLTYKGLKPVVGGEWGEGLDGTPRFVSIHPVSGFPIVVATTMTHDAMLGTWRRDALILAMGTCGAVIAIMLLLVVLMRKVRRMKESEALLARQNEQLARSSQLLLDAQRIGRLGHWTADPGGEYAVWSHQLFEISGLPPEPRVPFSKMLEIVHPDDVADYVRQRDRARKLGNAYTHEMRFLRPDGEVRWVRIEADPRLHADGGLWHFFGIVQDITEQKIAETVAEEARLRLVDAIEGLTEGFVLFDKDDRFVMVNTHFREMFPAWAALMTPGVRYEDLLRKAHAQGLVRSKGDKFEEWLQRKLAWHFAGSRPIERRESNGRWVQSIDHRTSDGGTVGLRTDITAFKTIQDELEQKLAYVQAIRSDLEDQKRELEETGAELRAARDAAEAANRAKSDFLAIMSHEIRTPLSGMVGMVDLLRGTGLSEEQQRYTVLAQESADLLLQVINDILDFSKLEAGRLVSESIDFDPRHLIEGVATVMGEKARKQNLAMSLVIAPGLPPYLKGDPTRLRQVTLNLVANAIKFTEQGSVRIEVDHVEESDGRIGLKVAVADTGIGMTPQVLANVFDPFVQADTSISRKYGGSGLGLAICKQLCATMGGSIGVDSELGKGSRFWFEVKCPRGDAPQAQPVAAVSTIDRPLEILVAEDSPIIATLISSLLTKQGFKPTMVVNGAKALAAVSEKLYDLVLMDVQMPEMDGISATKAIRQLAGPERDIPIIALTANALVGQRETYLAAGMNDYVTKPIQPKLLFAAIARRALKHTAAPALQPLDTSPGSREAPAAPVPLSGEVA